MSSRNLILILATSGFASTFSGRAVEPMVGVIARDLSSTPQTIALLSAAFALPYAFIQPILGPIGDALGKERVMKVSLALLFLALTCSVFAPNAATLVTTPSSSSASLALWVAVSITWGLPSSSST